jgi:hypothetical protein
MTVMWFLIRDASGDLMQMPGRQSVFYSEMDPPPFAPDPALITWIEAGSRPARRSWHIPASRRWILWAALLAVIIAVAVL